MPAKVSERGNEMTEYWTSTQFHNWKADCTKFVANHQAFEVRDVFNPEQEDFYVALCAGHGYTYAPASCSVICTPQVSN
jgi:hypothetical protein